MSRITKLKIFCHSTRFFTPTVCCLILSCEKMKYRLPNRKALKCMCVYVGGGGCQAREIPRINLEKMKVSICHALGGVLYTGFRHFGLDQPYCSPEVEYPRKLYR